MGNLLSSWFTYYLIRWKQSTMSSNYSEYHVKLVTLFKWGEGPWSWWVTGWSQSCIGRVMCSTSGCVCIASILESDYELPPTTLSQRHCRCWVAVLVWVPLKKDQTVMSSQSFQHNHSDDKSHCALEQKVLKIHKSVAMRLFKNFLKCL